MSIRRNKKRYISHIIEILTVILSLVFIIALFPKVDAVSTTTNQDTGEVQVGNLKLNKTATALGDGKYRINFKVTGKVDDVIPDKKDADIVIAINQSGALSEGAVLNLVKQYSNDFINNVVDVSGKVRVSIVSYGGGMGGDGNNDVIKERSCDLTSNKSLLNNTVNKIQGGSSNNTEAAIREIGRQLNNSYKDRPDVARYVLLFNDGLPSTSIGLSNQGQEKYYDANIKNAQKAYDELMGGMRGIGGIARAYPEWLQYESKDDGKYIKYNQIKNPSIPKVSFYGIGLFSKIDYYVDSSGKNNRVEAEEKYLEYLSTLQNVMPIRSNRDASGIELLPKEHKEDIDKFKNEYYAPDASKIPGIFKKVYDDIETKINNVLLKDAVIEDELSEYFVFPQTLSGQDIKDAILLEGISKDKVTIIPENKIRFDLGDIGRAGAEFSFVISLKDEYYSGKDIPTNKEATITGINPLDNKDVKGDFPIPKVDIMPIEGSITIIKEIENKKGVVDETFPISLTNTEGLGKYTFNLSGNSSTDKLKFFLKNKSTVPNKDVSGNYINVGLYKVSEVVPMNYKNTHIYYRYSEGEGWNELKDQFNINKKNNNVYIKVVNVLVNDKYWWDKESKENSIKF